MPRHLPTARVACPPAGCLALSLCPCEQTPFPPKKVQRQECKHTSHPTKLRNGRYKRLMTCGACGTNCGWCETCASTFEAGRGSTAPTLKKPGCALPVLLPQVGRRQKSSLGNSVTRAAKSENTELRTMEMQVAPRTAASSSRGRLCDVRVRASSGEMARELRFVVVVWVAKNSPAFHRGPNCLPEAIRDAGLAGTGGQAAASFSSDLPWAKKKKALPV